MGWSVKPHVDDVHHATHHKKTLLIETSKWKDLSTSTGSKHSKPLPFTTHFFVCSY
jgi:hypothetical protein